MLAVGNTATDLVVMDDFIYGEPVAAPTAATLLSASARRTADGVLLRWRMATVLRVAGFNVFRSDRGRLVRLNTTLVAAGLLGASGSHRYTWRDRAAPSRGALRYGLQAVGLDGTRTWLGSTTAR